MSDEELKAMVDAFPAWPLPNDVAADAIACQPGALHRTGTNLLTAAQTRAMFEHCLAVVRENDPMVAGLRWHVEALDRACRMALEALTLVTDVWAMRQPLDEWKGECERKALDEARAALAEVGR